jgi:hypothetical protein
MWEFRHKVRRLASSLIEPRRTGWHVSRGRSIDWLPPVLGPGDWSIGMMADRGAGWYLDRV